MNETTPPIMTINDELLAELEQLAGKATPGPWWIDSHGHNMVSESAGNKLVFTADDRMGKSERNKETGNLSHWPNDWDASFIATANPETIKALLAEREELKRDAERYRFIKDKQTFIWLVSDWFPTKESDQIDVDAAIDAARSSAD